MAPDAPAPEESAEVAAVSQVASPVADEIAAHEIEPQTIETEKDETEKIEAEQEHSPAIAADEAPEEEAAAATFADAVSRDEVEVAAGATKSRPAVRSQRITI